MALSNYLDLDELDFEFESDFDDSDFDESDLIDSDFDAAWDDESDADEFAGEFEDEFEDEGYGDADELDDDGRHWPLAAAMRAGLDDAYLDAITEELELAAEQMLASMSDAEAFNFERALRTVGRDLSRTANAVASNPTFRQVAGVALPTLGTVAGTALGGPLGAMVGGQLGQLAVSALPTAAVAKGPLPIVPTVQTAPPMPMSQGARPALQATGTASALNGSPAAAQAMVLLQNPSVMQALLSQALGQFGTPTVQGKPVGDVLGLVASTLQKAAADADEVRAWRDSLSPGDAEAWDDDVDADELNRDLYNELLSGAPGRGFS